MAHGKTFSKCVQFGKRCEALGEPLLIKQSLHQPRFLEPIHHKIIALIILVICAVSLGVPLGSHLTPSSDLIYTNITGEYEEGSSVLLLVTAQPVLGE